MRSTVIVRLTGLAVILAAAAISSDATADDIPCMAINDRHFAELRRIPEVTGSSVGYSTDDPSRLVIKVHVRPGASDAVKRGLPTQLDGAPVEVSEQGPSHRN
jgi:hypothetical protein